MDSKDGPQDLVLFSIAEAPLPHERDDFAPRLEPAEDGFVMPQLQEEGAIALAPKFLLQQRLLLSVFCFPVHADTGSELTDRAGEASAENKKALRNAGLIDGTEDYWAIGLRGMRAGQKLPAAGRGTGGRRDFA